MLRQGMLLLLVVASLSGCCGSLKAAVNAYGAAVDDSAATGAAFVAECAAVPSSDAAAEQKRQESCAKAKEKFAAISASAKKLSEAGK